MGEKEAVKQKTKKGGEKMDKVKSLRSLKVKIRKGFYFEGNLGDSLNDEKSPDMWVSALEIETENYGKKLFYYLALNGEVLAIQEYFSWKDVEQIFDEDSQEWKVIKGRWFFFMPLDSFKDEADVEDFIKNRWGDS
jgi:hypothetical protein